MAIKAMVFIDGNWLYKSRQALFSKLNEGNGFEIDYRHLPKVICEDVANYVDQDVDCVRTVYFGTIPSYRSGFNTGKQNSFYDFLESSCGYETEIHEVDVNGDGTRNDEQWVHAALSSAMLFYAAQNAFDLAVTLGDDPNYAPALRRVRMMGKRVQVVGVHGVDGRSVPPNAVYLQSRVSDFPPIYLEDHAEAVRLVRETQKRVCKQCGREEQTTWAGPEFFCSQCRGRHRGADEEAETDRD